MDLAQRLPKERLLRWEAAGHGMFLHFGMSTFVGEECPDGQADPACFAPDQLDTDGWVRLAKDAGMRYVVLTAKHVAGHCLWPSRQTDYAVGAEQDVVGRLANSCARYGLAMGLYYCSWDNHHRLGSVTPDAAGIYSAKASPAYVDFQLEQLSELLTQYGDIWEIWIDIPQMLGPEGRRACYDLCASLQPDCVVVMNQGSIGSSVLDTEHAWPFDVSTRERQYPECQRWGQGNEGTTTGHLREYEIKGSRYYIPTEICDCLGYWWFHDERDRPRTPREVAAMRMLARERGANLLLNVPPDRTGRIPEEFRRALLEGAELDARLR